LACQLTDVVSRGGRLLLNVGQTAEGVIPELQQASLRSLGRWMAQVGDVIRASHPASGSVVRPTNEPWVRWLDTPEHLVVLVDQTGDTTLDVNEDALGGDAEVRAAPGWCASSAAACGWPWGSSPTARPRFSFPSGDLVENRFGGGGSRCTGSTSTRVIVYMPLAGGPLTARPSPSTEEGPIK
jgi:hypothetical protein